MLSSVTRVEGKTDSCQVSSDLHTQAGAPECVGMGKRPKLNKQGGNTHHLAPSKPASPLGAPRGGFSKFSGFIFCPQSQLPKTEYKTPGLRLPAPHLPATEYTGASREVVPIPRGSSWCCRETGVEGIREASDGGGGRQGKAEEQTKTGQESRDRRGEERWSRQRGGSRAPGHWPWSQTPERPSRRR